MKDDNTTTLEKAMIYGALAYIIIPNDLLPRHLFKFLGLVDDVAVATWVFNKIDSKITPQIKFDVENLLDEWFGSGGAYGTPTEA